MNMTGKILITLAVLLFSCSYGQAAETVHLYLKSSGEDIVGDTTSLKKQVLQDLIAEHIQQKSQAKGTASTTGRRTYEPIIIRKRIDKSSPLIEKAAKQKTRLDSAFIKHRGKDGKPYKIELEKAIITSYQLGNSGNDEAIKIKFSGLRVIE